MYNSQTKQMAVIYISLILNVVVIFLTQIICFFIVLGYCYQGLKKSWISGCPLDKQLSYFAHLGPLLARLS